MFPSWAKIGAKVVYFRDRPDGMHPEVPSPVVGRVYTISRIGMAFNGAGPAIISVEEINSMSPLVGECGYDLADFRPAVEPKSEAEDMSLFRDLIRQPEHA